MFSAEYDREIKTAFEKQMALLDERLQEMRQNQGVGQGLPRALSARLLGERKREILDTIARCSEDEAQALTFLYSAMPLSDLLDYPASLFLAYARHGVYLWNQGLFAGRVPEKIFANYVLHYRVNNEDIADVRGFFHDRIMAAAEEGSRLAQGGSMYDAAIEVNFWCAREATYRSTDGRTQNPRTMFGVTMGRCGEESTLGVTALRSVGIPARQIYAPLWTHCDDNHAWVEVWCDGEWHFFGACEPEERLDRGWFVEPASRAMILHTRWFGKDDPQELQVGPKGMAKVLNQMERYAQTVRLTVKAVDETGLPVPGARLNFQVANHGELGSVALVRAGTEGEDCGVVRLTTGLGDLYISADAGSGQEKRALQGNGAPQSKKGTLQDGGTLQSNGTLQGGGSLYGETMVSLRELAPGESAECTVVLREKPECWEGWRELEFHAPKPAEIHNGVLTREQEESGAARLAKAAEYRQRKAAGLYDQREAERVLGRFSGEDRALAEDILRKAHGNIGEILRFLEWEALELDCGFGCGEEGCWETPAPDHWKLEVLKTLREKDYWDIKADVLKDCCRAAAAYAGTVPEEIFFRYLVCPRVSDELLVCCREFLRRCIDEETKERIRRNPDCLPELAEQWIVSMPEQEYENLITTSVGCVRGGVGSSHSREVFCVNLYRSLGIPARLSHFDGRIEYYCEDGDRKEAGGEENGCGENSHKNDSSDGNCCKENSRKENSCKENSCRENSGEAGCGGKDSPRGCFRAAGASREESGEAACSLTLVEDGNVKLSDWEHYSLERFEGDGFLRLGLWGKTEEMRDGRLELKLRPGIYRIFTVNRKKNGNQLARMAVFALQSGEHKEMVISLKEVSVEALLTRIGIEDFELAHLDGRKEKLSALSGGGKALFLWLEVTREPTEHILNELYEKKEDFRELTAPVYAVLKSPEDLKNATLHRTMEALPGICPLLDDFGENYRTLAKTLGREVGKLPLAVVAEAGRECIYSDAGYNVGLADMLWKVLQ